MSLIVTGFAPVKDVQLGVTPELKKTDENTKLVFIDLAGGKQRLGGSALAQVAGQLGDSSPDAESPKELVDFFKNIQALIQARKILAYHDRSDGGLFTALCEMAFAGKTGIDVDLDKGTLEELFNEELGVVVQVREK